MGDSRDLARREKNFKGNTKPYIGRATFWQSFKDALDQMIYFILGILVVISIITGMINDPKFGWVKGVTILCALFFLILLTSLADYFKDKRFVEISNIAKDEYLPVLRGKEGATQTVNVWNLVVGDVVILDAGDIVPADCVLIDGSRNLRVEEEVWQNKDDAGKNFYNWIESEKGEQDPFLFADGHVLEGSCKVVVACVGTKDTSSRRDPDMLDLSEESELQKRLTKFANNLTLIGTIASLAILVLAIILLCISLGVSDEFNWTLFLARLMDAITLTVILIIVAIPEGLPMVITVSLAFCVKRMVTNDGVLIKDTTKTEVLGQVTEVCMGKTQTLTTEEMTVERFFV